MKKVIAIFVAVMMMAMALTGCGSKSSSGDTIKIGGIGPITGPYANYGLSVQYAAQIAVDEINANGGIAGKQIEFKMEDSQGDPESAVNAYGALIDWGMNISIGTVLSGEMKSVSSAAVDDDILLLSPSASANNAVEGNPKAFRVCFYDSYQGTAAADYIADLGITTEVAALYESDIDYSVGLYSSFAEECAARGITIVETQTFTDSTSTDFSTQINALVASGVKLIFIPFYAEEASTFLTQAQGKFGDDVLFFGADGLDGILTKVEQDPTIANNVLMLTPFAADSQESNIQNFVKAYQDKHGATPDQFAADAYDAIYAIKDAVEQNNGSTSGTELASILTSMSFSGLTGTMTWDAEGNTSKNAQAILYFDGVGSTFSK